MGGVSYLIFRYSSNCVLQGRLGGLEADDNTGRLALCTQCREKQRVLDTSGASPLPVEHKANTNNFGKPAAQRTPTHFRPLALLGSLPDKLRPYS